MTKADINNLTNAQTSEFMTNAWNALEKITNMTNAAIADKSAAADALLELDGEDCDRRSYWDALKRAHCAKGRAEALQDVLAVYQQAFDTLQKKAVSNV